MKEGDVILAPLPQADGVVKNRPALFLREMPPFGDLLACGISTQLRQQTPDFDELITLGDSDFAVSGLVADSVIRLGYLAVLSRKSIPGGIGAVAPERHARLLRKLSAYLVARTRSL